LNQTILIILAILICAALIHGSIPARRAFQKKLPNQPGMIPTTHSNSGSHAIKPSPVINQENPHPTYSNLNHRLNILTLRPGAPEAEGWPLRTHESEPLSNDQPGSSTSFTPARNLLTPIKPISPELAQLEDLRHGTPEEKRLALERYRSMSDPKDPKDFNVRLRGYLKSAGSLNQRKDIEDLYFRYKNHSLLSLYTLATMGDCFIGINTDLQKDLYERVIETVHQTKTRLHQDMIALYMAHTGLGNISDKNKAFNHFLMALEIAKRIEDHLLQGRALIRLGATCSDLKNKRRYYNQALEIAEKLNNSPLRTKALEGLNIQ
jgi:tetratricopeptide (TPR) repeat protein